MVEDEAELTKPESRAELVSVAAKGRRDRVIRELEGGDAADPVTDEIEFTSIQSAEGLLGRLLIVFANGATDRDER